MKVKIDHVNISVSNLAESIEWYKKLFGFEKVEEGLSLTGVKWAIAANHDSMIVMNEFSKKDADRNTDTSTHRVYHYGFRVDDAELWRTKIVEFQLRLYYGGEIEYPHSRSWYVHDPSGHEIEVSCTNDGGSLKFPDQQDLK